jgi:preprotein translocase subunit SecD
LGRSVRYSIKEGFDDAWKAISASNISSLITALVLYVFGTSIVKGFAVTYGIGIILSMFTAIVVTRSILTIVLSRPSTHKEFLLAVKNISQEK